MSFWKRKVKKENGTENLSEQHCPPLLKWDIYMYELVGQIPFFTYSNSWDHSASSNLVLVNTLDAYITL